MMSGCAVREDHNQNILPRKNNSTRRIDGIVMAMIALSRVFAPDRTSRYYETDQLEVF